jgi:hypothetical protein
VAEAVTDALGDALTEGEEEPDGDVLGVAEAVADGEALVVGAQLVVGEGLQEGLGLADAVVVAEALTDGEGEVEALAEVLGVAVAVGEQLDVAATAVPPNGPVSAASATEASRTAAPDARPASPILCSFSQLGRVGRKIVTVPRVVQLLHPGSQVPRSLHQSLVSQMAGYLDNHRDSR